MSLVGLFSGRGPSGFGYDSTAEEVTEGLDLTGRTYLLTGCNSGLGEETLRVLSLRGAEIIAAARTEAKAAAALAGRPGTAIACDLSEPASVEAAVARVRQLAKLDGIIANAGIMALPTRQVKHGIELQLLTNHFGHFQLVTGLLDRLTQRGRVVMVSSRAHTRAYDEGIRLDDLDATHDYTAWGAYGQSKLANLLFAKALAKRLAREQTANSLHPGVIVTNLGRHMPGALQVGMKGIAPILFKTIPKGAATQTYLATHPTVIDTTGEYFADCNPAATSAHGKDDALAEALWERSEAVVASW